MLWAKIFKERPWFSIIFFISCLAFLLLAYAVIQMINSSATQYSLSHKLATVERIETDLSNLLDKCQEAVLAGKYSLFYLHSGKFKDLIAKMGKLSLSEKWTQKMNQRVGEWEALCKKFKDATTLHQKRQMLKKIVAFEPKISILVEAPAIETRRALELSQINLRNVVSVFLVAGALFILLGLSAIVSALGYFKDIYEALRVEAATDPLTGLWVRRPFQQRLLECLERAKRLGSTVALIYMDIDKFKRVNDTYGHRLGDLVLKEIAARIQQRVRIYDIPARWGGEEFTIILPETDRSTAYHVAERIRAEIQKPIDILSQIHLESVSERFKKLFESRASDEQNTSISVSTSLGIAIYPEDALSIPELLEKADMGLLLAKRKGGNTIEFPRAAEREEKCFSILDAILEAADARIGALCLRENNQIIPKAIRGGDEELLCSPPFIKWVKSKKCKPMVATLETFSRYKSLSKPIALMRKRGIKSIFITPLRPNNQFEGLLCLLDQHANKFKPLQAQKIANLATQISLGLKYWRPPEPIRYKYITPPSWQDVKLESILRLTLRIVIQLAKAEAGILRVYQEGLLLKEGKEVELHQEESAQWATKLNIPLISEEIIQVPLSNNTKLLGLLSLKINYYPQPDDEELKLSVSLVNQLANSLLEVYEGDSQQAKFDFICAIADLIEIRNLYPIGHHLEVFDLANKIAQEFWLPSSQIEDILLAALLHDIGKISISNEILNKPEKLTPQEFETVKRHVTYALDLLQGLAGFERVIPIIMNHHEHWNGEGYPHGFKSEQIPISSRILSVADVFKIITSDRPYRVGKPTPEAVRELKDCAGTQFDPIVVDKAIKILAREEGIKNISTWFSTEFTEKRKEG